MNEMYSYIIGHNNQISIKIEEGLAKCGVVRSREILLCILKQLKQFYTNLKPSKLPLPSPRIETKRC